MTMMNFLLLFLRLLPFEIPSNWQSVHVDNMSLDVREIFAMKSIQNNNNSQWVVWAEKRQQEEVEILVWIFFCYFSWWVDTEGKITGKSRNRLVRTHNVVQCVCHDRYISILGQSHIHSVQLNISRAHCSTNHHHYKFQLRMNFSGRITISLLINESVYQHCSFHSLPAHPTIS